MSGISVEKDTIHGTEECGSPEDPNRSCDDESLSDVESQVVTSLMAVITRQGEKYYHEYQSPLPMERGAASYALPTWLVIAIAVLSLIGVVGGVLELIVQYHFVW